MDVNKDILTLIGAFYNHEIDYFGIYIEGFGGLFVRRTEDGMVMGYKDKDKHFSEDDYVTIFFDKNGLKGLHRTVSDTEAKVYMKYNVDYFDSPYGIKKLVQDIQKRTNVPFAIKPLLIVLYRILEWVYEAGCNDVKVLENSQALKLGMKSPCIYVMPRFIERSFLPLYNKTLLWQSRIHKFKFREKPTEGFKEQHFPGSQITRYLKKKRNPNV